MNILVVTNDIDNTIQKLSRLYDKHPPNQHYVFPCVVLTTDTAASSLLNPDSYNHPNKHIILTTDDPTKLWQGVRERLLDLIIETKNEDAAEWLVSLLSGSPP